MSPERIFVSYMTIVRGEVNRYLRLWKQTLLPPIITTTLYYVIFGTFIGSQIGPINGFDYMLFIVPGLTMMAVINSSFMHTVSSFYFAKFQHNLEELLVSPTPYWVMIAGYITGGVLRGLSVGTLVLGTALFFTDLQIENIFLVLLFAILTATLFSLAGLLNGMYAKSFDGISIIPTFVLTPLTYLGGVFYSVTVLPEFWQNISQFNPILYMVNGFRYGFLGVSDVSVWFSASILIVANIVFLAYIIHLFRIGFGFRQ